MTDGGLLAPGFLFSQHSLNTYLRCPRWFLLKYVDKQPWPMPDGGTPRAYEEYMRLGRVFHHWLLRQHLGLDMDPIVAASEDARLQRWWAAWRSFDHSALPSGVREAELPVVVRLGDHRLYARFDLLALEPRGDALIVDWKTLESRPAQHILATRVQTRVYLHCLVAAGEMLTGGVPIDPERVRMLYWFANYPGDPGIIDYSADEYAAAGRNLGGLMARIATLPREAFAACDDVRTCGTCNYRSLCGRAPASLSADEEMAWLEEEVDWDVDLEDVPEVEY